MNQMKLEELLKKLADVLQEPPPSTLYYKISSQIHMMIEKEQIKKNLKSEALISDTEISYGVKQIRGVTVFTAKYPEAKDVLLAGNFNSWNPEPMQRIKENGPWQARFKLSQGRYEYRFIVDGTWQADPFNSWKKKNQYNEDNSVVEVKEDNCAIELQTTPCYV